jgi:epoxide hydrolase-like predicted phosphatase
MIRAAIFDFGGVMTTSPREGLHHYEQELDLPQGSLYRLIAGDRAQNSPWHQLERREISLTQFWREIRKRARSELGVKLSMRGLALSFARTFEARPRMVQLVRALRRDMATVLLTNNVAELDSFWRPIIPVSELFHTVIDSSAVGVRKPDPRIFDLALEATRSLPEETLFVDDTLEHVKAALALGLVAIHFDDEDAVVARIRELTGQDTILT